MDPAPPGAEPPNSTFWKWLAIRVALVLALAAVAYFIGERPPASEPEAGSGAPPAAPTVGDAGGPGDRGQNPGDPNAAGANAVDPNAGEPGDTESGQSEPSRPDGAKSPVAQRADDTGAADDRATPNVTGRDQTPAQATAPASKTSTAKNGGEDASSKGDKGSPPPIGTTAAGSSKTTSVGTTVRAPESSATTGTKPAEEGKGPRPPPGSTAANPSGRTNVKPTTPADTGKTKPKTPDEIIVKGQVIKDQSNRVVYRGDIDLTPTLERIRKGVRNEHRNDGSFFQNREGRLPQRRDGYYREYVHPTPGVGGPGPQRIIIGAEGETYYTADHYKSFKKVR